MRRIILLLLLPIFSFAQTRQSGGISFTPQWNYKIAAGDTTWQFGNTLMSPQQFPYILTKWQSDQRYAPISGGGYVPTSRTITALYGLIGGGDLTTNRSFIVDTANIVTKTYGTRWLTQTSAASTYQPLLGFTAENIANKTATQSSSTTTYPNWLGVTNYVTGLSSVYQPLNAKLTSISALTNSAGVLTNDGSGGFSYVAPSTGTVTSITPGYGFTSSTPITTSGTMTIDTTKLQTVTGSSNNTETMYRKTFVAPIANNLTINGAGGTGFVNLGGTTTVAATPTSGMTLFSRSTNRLSLLGTNGFEALIGTTAYTVGHIVSLPDASGVLMTNPLTTGGDIPYLSASSSAGTNVARRAIGTNGFLLGAVSGLPDYIDPATITVGTVTTNANLTGPITSVGNATSISKNIALNGGAANAWNANKNSIDIDATNGNGVFGTSSTFKAVGLIRNAYISALRNSTLTRVTNGSAASLNIESVPGSLLYQYLRYGAAGTSTGTQTTAFKVDSLGNQTNNGTLIAQTPLGATTDSVVVKLSNTEKFGAVGTNGTGDVVKTTSPTLVTPTLGVASATSLNITGTSGAGFINLADNSPVSTIPTPASGINISGATNGLAFKGANGFSSVISTSLLTGGKTISLPNATNSIIMTNPLTTTGDISYLSANSTTGTNVARLGIGSTGDILTVSGGLPAWSSGSTNFIQNQQASAQTANMWIDGDIYSRSISTASNGAGYTAFLQNVGSTGAGLYLQGGATKATSSGGAYALTVTSYSNAAIAKFYSDEIDFSVPLVGSSIAKSGGTSTQILMADGSTTNTTAYAPATTTPQIVASYPITTRTSVGTLISYVAPVDGMYKVDMSIIITSIATNTLQASVTYTDTQGNVRTLNGNIYSNNTFAVTWGGMGITSGNNLLCKAGTTVTVAITNPVSGGSNTFDISSRLTYMP